MNNGSWATKKYWNTRWITDQGASVICACTPFYLGVYTVLFYSHAASSTPSVNVYAISARAGGKFYSLRRRQQHLLLLVLPAQQRSSSNILNFLLVFVSTLFRNYLYLFWSSNCSSFHYFVDQFGCIYWKHNQIVSWYLFYFEL